MHPRVNRRVCRRLFHEAEQQEESNPPEEVQMESVPLEGVVVSEPLEDVLMESNPIECV
jgi:hypothetical protein